MISSRRRRRPEDRGPRSRGGLRGNHSSNGSRVPKRATDSPEVSRRRPSRWPKELTWSARTTSARPCKRPAWSIASFAVKSFNPRDDSYRNGNAEGHRVDPRGLRGHRHRDGLFSFVPPDLSRGPRGGVPDPRDRDREAP